MTDDAIQGIRKRHGVADVQLHAAVDAATIERPADLAAYIDHTALKPEVTEEDVRTLCAQARSHGFASVCVNPCFTSLAADLLQDGPSRVCTVAGFPLGASAPAIKAAETKRAVADGADEVDMVMNVGWFKSGRHDWVVEDMRGVVDAAAAGNAGAVVKVIIETVLLSDEEKVVACVLAEKAGADFVKTSTGFGAAGATAADVELMRRAVAGRLHVKAAGGIRSFDAARSMIHSGASRIGASASVDIVTRSQSS